MRSRLYLRWLLVHASCYGRKCPGFVMGRRGLLWFFCLGLGSRCCLQPWFFVDFNNLYDFFVFLMIFLKRSFINICLIYLSLIRIQFNLMDWLGEDSSSNGTQLDFIFVRLLLKVRFEYWDWSGTNYWSKCSLHKNPIGLFKYHISWTIKTKRKLHHTTTNQPHLNLPSSRKDYSHPLYSPAHHSLFSYSFFSFSSWWLSSSFLDSLQNHSPHLSPL